MALPPYFTTTILPWYFISHGSAPARVAAFGVGLRFGLGRSWIVVHEE